MRGDVGADLVGRQHVEQRGLARIVKTEEKDLGVLRVETCKKSSIERRSNHTTALIAASSRRNWPSNGALLFRQPRRSADIATLMLAPSLIKDGKSVAARLMSSHHIPCVCGVPFLAI
jgi:hypothetical protein